MKNILLSFSFLISSCAFVLAPSGNGIINTDVSEIIYYDPYIKPMEKVTLCSKNILGLFSYGDSSFAAVKLQSGIRKIATMEKTYSSFMMVYAKSCLIVKGE